MNPLSIIWSIIQRNFRFTWAPFLLTPEEYWRHLKGEQKDHQMVATGILLFLGVCFLGTGYLYYRFGTTWWDVSIFIILLCLTVAAFVYAFSSNSPRRWWKTVLGLSIVFICISLALIPFFGVGLFTMYLSISHLVCQIRVRKLVG